MAIGSIVLPAMEDAGLPQDASGRVSITTSGALGILIPPSDRDGHVLRRRPTGAVVTGPGGERVSSASVGQMFIAGVILRALILATMLGTTTW